MDPTHFVSYTRSSLLLLQSGAVDIHLCSQSSIIFPWGDGLCLQSQYSFVLRSSVDPSSSNALFYHLPVYRYRSLLSPTHPFVHSIPLAHITSLARPRQYLYMHYIIRPFHAVLLFFPSPTHPLTLTHRRIPPYYYYLFYCAPATHVGSLHCTAPPVLSSFISHCISTFDFCLCIFGCRRRRP